MKKNEIIFVSGIDTEIGKTYATAQLAKELSREGHRVITQKPVQTGCTHFSEDLAKHDELTGTQTSEEVNQHRCSYLFTYPASPHLSAEMEGVNIDLARIDADTAWLLKHGFDCVIMEGAGGLMVPLTRTLLTIDFIAERHYPVALVTSGRLGSINHTLLSIEALLQRNIPIAAILYNLYPGDTAEIESETRSYLHHYIAENLPECRWLDIPNMAGSQSKSA